jgi:hypothetical protein
MKENYKIITDEKALREFIDWLPELNDGECYYCMLYARDKYFKELGRSSVKLKRFTSSKTYLFEKIKQLECEVGSYKVGELSIPNEALYLQIMPNPRSQTKSAKFLFKYLVDALFAPYNGFSLHQETLTAYQKNPSKMRFFDFDFDNTTIEEMSPEINKVINPEAINYIKSRGGFHLLVEINKISPEFKKNYYNNIKKLLHVDCSGDELCPIPGCVQGLFTPVLYAAK